MPSGYKTIIPAETPPVGVHLTVVAALEGLPTDMSGAPSLFDLPPGARTSPHMLPDAKAALVRAPRA